MNLQISLSSDSPSVVEDIENALSSIQTFREGLYKTTIKPPDPGPCSIQYNEKTIPATIVCALSDGTAYIRYAMDGRDHYTWVSWDKIYPPIRHIPPEPEPKAKNRNTNSLETGSNENRNKKEEKREFYNLFMRIDKKCKSKDIESL